METNNNIGRIINLFNEFMDDRAGRSLVADASEMIQVDTSQIGDEFHWLDERRVELSTVDAEDRMCAYAEFQRWARDIAETEGGWIYYEYGDIRRWAKEKWVEAGKDLDSRLQNNEPTEVDPVFHDSRSGAKIMNYIVHYAEKMSVKQLFKAKNRLFALRGKDVAAKDRLSYDLYIKCMIMVLEQIVEQTGSDRKLLAKFVDMELQQGADPGCGYRVDVADMNLPMEYAIDLKRDAERVAGRHNISFEEAFLMLQAQRTEIDRINYVCETETKEESIEFVQGPLEWKTRVKHLVKDGKPILCPWCGKEGGFHEECLVEYQIDYCEEEEDSYEDPDMGMELDIYPDLVTKVEALEKEDRKDLILFIAKTKEEIAKRESNCEWCVGDLKLKSCECREEAYQELIYSFDSCHSEEAFYDTLMYNEWRKDTIAECGGVKRMMPKVIYPTPVYDDSEEMPF